MISWDAFKRMGEKFVIQPVNQSDFWSMEESTKNQPICSSYFRFISDCRRPEFDLIRTSILSGKTIDWKSTRFLSRFYCENGSKIVTNLIIKYWQQFLVRIWWENFRSVFDQDSIRFPRRSWSTKRKKKRSDQILLVLYPNVPEHLCFVLSPSWIHNVIHLRREEWKYIDPQSDIEWLNGILFAHMT